MTRNANSENHDVCWKQRFDNFQRAMHQLTLAIELKEKLQLSDLEQQGLIQGFEFTHELAWNVFKDYLEMEGILVMIILSRPHAQTTTRSITARFCSIATTATASRPRSRRWAIPRGLA